MTKQELFRLMKGTIIVSCQATPGEPLYDPERSVMPLMARAARQAGAKMIVDSDTHAPENLMDEAAARTVARGAGMTDEEVEELLNDCLDVVTHKSGGLGDILDQGLFCYVGHD